MAAASASSSGSSISPRIMAASKGVWGSMVSGYTDTWFAPRATASRMLSAKDSALCPGMPHIRSHRYVLEALLGRAHRRPGSLGVVGAAQDAQHLVVEGLHAKGEPVHPERPDIPHHGRRKTFGVRLHRALDLGFEMHRHRQRIKKHRKSSHADIARRPPAQIHRLNGSELPLPRGSANIHHERFHVLVNNRRVPFYRRSGEIAVPAPLHAERNMQVQCFIRVISHDRPLFPAG